MEYEDFVLELGADAGRPTVRVLRSPAGESAPEALLLAWGEDETVRLAAAFARSADAKREGRDLGSSKVAEASIAEIGDKLFRALFPEAVRSLYQQSLGRVAERGQGLRIRIVLSLTTTGVAQLHTVPWEYLACDGHFLCLSLDISIVRYPVLGLPGDRPPVSAPLSILVLPGEDLSEKELDLAEEQRELERAWSESGNVRIHVLRECTLNALREELMEREYHALHFMGHGGFSAATGEGTLAFKTKQGNRLWVSGTELAEQLRDRSSLRLVFLNACRTAQAGAVAPYAGVATALLRAGIPAVVAMQFPISDPAALALSRAFYRRIARGDTVDAAVTEGRLAIRRLAPDNAEWGTPVLFERLTSGRIVEPENAWRRWGTSLVGIAGSIGRRLAGSPSQLSWLSLPGKLAIWLLVPVLLGVSLLKGSLPRLPSSGAHFSPGQGAGRPAPTPTIVPIGPSGVLAGVDPRDLLIEDRWGTTNFINPNSGKVIATVDGEYEGTEIDNPMRVSLSGGYGEYDISNGKSRWLTPFPNSSSESARPFFSSDRTKGIFFVKGDAWIVDLDWQAFRIKNPRQVTQIGALGAYQQGDVRWASDNIVFVKNFRVDLVTGKVSEPFGGATPDFSPDSKYSIGKRDGKAGFYVYDAINDTWASLPGLKREFGDQDLWISDTEIVSQQSSPSISRADFWLIDVTNPGQRSHLMEVPKVWTYITFNIENWGRYLFARAADQPLRIIVEIRSGRKLPVQYEPKLFSPLGDSQFILTSRSTGSLDEKGTWLINFETGAAQRITPYIAEQAVALERKKLVFFVANGDLWRAGFDGKGLVKLGASPPGVLRAPNPIKLP